jgi:chorismate mutase/prephenate dehydratase
MSDELDKIRKEIDRLDDELAALIERRAAQAKKIGELKAGGAAYRPERESQILERVAKGNGLLAGERMSAVFREIISACRGLEEAIRVSYLGPEGTFSEQAVRKHFGAAVDTLPVVSVDEAFRRCESGGAQFTVVPAENSTEGVVGRTLDLLVTTPLRICAEVELRVQQNLLSKESNLTAIKRVYSHAQSLAQCNGWLAQNLPGVERVPVASNAEAARRAAQEPGAAARAGHAPRVRDGLGPLAGQAAGERYGLDALARSIEDDPNNTTRFLVLGNIDPAPSGRDRTSLVMSAENKPGAVHALLTPLAAHGVSMSRIESRPARARTALWEYLFFIDLEGHQKDERVAAALAALRSKAPYLKILGSYPVAVS